MSMLFNAIMPRNCLKQVKKKGSRGSLFLMQTLLLSDINASACSAQYCTRYPMQKLHSHRVSACGRGFDNAVITLGRRSFD